MHIHDFAFEMLDEVVAMLNEEIQQTCTMLDLLRRKSLQYLRLPEAGASVCSRCLYESPCACGDLAPAKLCVPHDDSAPAKPIRSAYAYKRPATQVGRWMERDATASAKVMDWAIHASDRRAEKDERQDDAAQPPPEPTLSELLCYMITENRLPALYQQTRRLDVGSQAKEPNLEHLRPPGDAHTDTVPLFPFLRTGSPFVPHKKSKRTGNPNFRARQSHAFRLLPPPFTARGGVRRSAIFPTRRRDRKEE